VRANPPEKINGKDYRWCNFVDLGDLSENTRKFALKFANPNAAARAAELIETYESYTAAKTAAEETSGHSAAELALDQAVAAMDEIYEQMLTHVPTTFEGMKAIASIERKSFGNIELPHSRRTYCSARDRSQSDDACEKSEACDRRADLTAIRSPVASVFRSRPKPAGLIPTPS
jgi:hypothetical protein